MKTGQGGGSPLGPGEKSDGRLSRILGRGLAETVVLLVADGSDVLNEMEKVVVTEPRSEVAVGDSDGSDDSDVSDVSDARFCTLRHWASCSESMTHFSPSQTGDRSSRIRVSAGAAARAQAARQTKTATRTAHDSRGRRGGWSGRRWDGDGIRERAGLRGTGGAAAGFIVSQQLQARRARDTGATSLCATAARCRIVGVVNERLGADWAGQTGGTGGQQVGAPRTCTTLLQLEASTAVVATGSIANAHTRQGPMILYVDRCGRALDGRVIVRRTSPRGQGKEYNGTVAVGAVLWCFLIGGQ